MTPTQLEALLEYIDARIADAFYAGQCGVDTDADGNEKRTATRSEAIRNLRREFLNKPEAE